MRYEPYKFDGLKQLMQHAYNYGWYGKRENLLQVTMQGDFEGWYGRASETWEHRFTVRFRIPEMGGYGKKEEEKVYTESAETLEEACQKILRQLQDA